jgi:hypothetical protein
VQEFNLGILQLARNDRHPAAWVYSLQGKNDWTYQGCTYRETQSIMRPLCFEERFSIGGFVLYKGLPVAESAKESAK